MNKLHAVVFQIGRVGLLLVLVGVVTSPVSATDFGVRGGVYTERSKPFLGAELLTRAGDDLYFNPNVEYVFVDNGQLWTFNFDGHWDLPTHEPTALCRPANDSVAARSCTP
jgi:hypothetical protein